MKKTQPLTEVEMYAGAYFLAVSAHCGQTDKSGRDYIEHPQRIADSFIGYTEKTIAILHDVLEDTWVTEEMLRNMFPDMIVDAVMFLTRKENESYGDFIKRMCTGGVAAFLARKVKIVDLTDNMNLGRLKEITDEDLDRVKKYNKWRTYLLNFTDYGKYE